MRVLLTLILLTAISATPAGAAVGTWWNGFATNSVVGPVFDLLVDGDQLIVAGSFGQAGNHEIQNIAAFDGQAWSPASEDAPQGFSWTVEHTAMHAGRIHISSWRGIFELTELGWNRLDMCSGDSSESMQVWDLMNWNGGLQAVGHLWRFEGPSAPLRASLQSTCFESPPSSPLSSGVIQRAIEYQGDLVLAGDFHLELTVMENMLRWDGTTLEAFDQGFFVPSNGGIVRDLELYGESLLAFGWLQAGGFPSGVVEYDGQQWGDFEGGRVDGEILAATVHDGMVYIAGDFTAVQGVPAAGLARWTGSAWESLADTPIIGADFPVYDMEFFNGQLYLAGDFGVVDGVLSRSLARWFPPLAVDAPPSADRRELRLSAAPNPFNPQTVLHYELRGVGEARLDIYDLAGRRVGGVDLRDRGEGPGSWVWNGRDTAGNGLASGVYFVRLREGKLEQRLRVTLLK